MRSTVDPKIIQKELGAEVRRRRKSLDLSQAGLAQLAQVHVNVIGRLERGRYNPSINVLCWIAAALDTSLVGLLAQTQAIPRARRENLKTE
jgi:transcriptional regulator with XRE-family HTH domain